MTDLEKFAAHVRAGGDPSTWTRALSCCDCARETSRLWGTRCYDCTVLQFADFPHTFAALKGEKK